MNKLPARTALVLIDVQKGFDSPYWGERNNLQAEAQMEKLLSAWRCAKLPVVHVQHDSEEEQSPLLPGQSGNDFKEAFEPKYGEHVEKSTSIALLSAQPWRAICAQIALILSSSQV